ncbi:hypothetical protein HOD29_02540 [archaeon]|jgi:hypothetical protein|nr:hypothetical protein [archaeon]
MKTVILTILAIIFIGATIGGLYEFSSFENKNIWETWIPWIPAIGFVLISSSSFILQSWRMKWLKRFFQKVNSNNQ